MPIYEYECSYCNVVEEFIEPVTAPSRRVCTHCGRLSDRIVSNFSFDIPGFKNGQHMTEDDA